MKIKYIIAHASAVTPKMSYNKATHITRVVYRNNQQQLKLSARDIISIFFEQTLLTDYLFNANPSNTVLFDYQNTLQDNFEKYFASGELKDEVLAQQQISAPDVKILQKFIIEGQTLPGSSISELVHSFTGPNQSEFASVPKDFAIPYLSLQSNSLRALFKGAEYANPLVLSPVCRKDKNDKTAITITMYARPYISMRNIDQNLFDRNVTMQYICSMNRNGGSWQELIDTVQSLYVKTGNPTSAFESLSGVLNHYFHRKALPAVLSSKQYSRQLLNILKYAMENNTSILQKEENDLGQLAAIFGYLRDDRLNYLTMTNPVMAAKEKWEQQTELKFLAGYSLVGYVMAADDPDTSSEKPPADDDTDDTTVDDDQPENEEDGEDPEDPFDDGDDFADDADDEQADDDSGDGNGSSTSTDTSSSSDSSSDSSDSGVDPEDVNPLIELIDDETFDEYLDRGTLQYRIKALINNPPATISMQDVEFLKYWFIQWFPCVSVATTREILGDLLELPLIK